MTQPVYYNLLLLVTLLASGAPSYAHVSVSTHSPETVKEHSEVDAISIHAISTDGKKGSATFKVITSQGNQVYCC